MPWILELLSLIGLLLVDREVMQMSPEQCPSIAKWFLFAQTVFVFGACLGEAKFIRLVENSVYRLIYSYSIMPALALALGLSMSALAKAGMHRLMIPEIVLAAFLGWQVDSHWGKLHQGYRVMTMTGAMLLVAGLFLLLSLDVWGDPAWNRIRLCLGLFMLCEGLMHWMFPEWHVHNAKTAVHYGDVMIPFAAICLLLWLGWSLTLYQRQSL